MLSNINKTLYLLVFTILIFSGCSSKNSDFSKSYHSSEYSYQQNNKINNDYQYSKIRNSKAMHRATMKSYTVMGKKYYPRLAHVDDKFYGIASWYGPDFHAKKTSNGEIYNMYGYTAAHKTLPMNTMVKVENLDNGLIVIVRINDRGPFVAGRIIDLSNVAAHKINMVKKGTANIKLTILGFNAIIASSNKKVIIKNKKYFLQVGVYSIVSSANSLKRKFEMILNKNENKVIIRNDLINNKKVKKVWINGFKSESDAYDFKEQNQLESAMIIIE